MIERKAAANLAAMTNTPWLLIVPVVAGFALWVALRAPGVAHALWRRSAEHRAAIIGLAVVATLGFVLNDSGVAVPGAMATVASAAFTYVAVDQLQPSGERRPMSRRAGTPPIARPLTP